jgi:hypothetical protein
MTARYLETDGQLLAVYEAMLTHPMAWSEQAPNIKQPFDFVGSALRAFLPPSQPWRKNRQFNIKRHLYIPMALMGQTWEAPEGPDGWPEDDAAWLTPQGLATRLQWAMSVPQLLRSDLPDPRVFVQSALGDRAPKIVRLAAKAAPRASDWCLTHLRFNACKESLHGLTAQAPPAFDPLCSAWVLCCGQPIDHPDEFCFRALGFPVGGHHSAWCDGWSRCAATLR